MILSEHLNKIVIVMLFLAVLISGAVVYSGHHYGVSQAKAYEGVLFGDELIQIDITMTEEDWQSMITSPLEKEYMAADISINGELVSNIGIRTKGNNSLSQISSRSDSDKYSLHINFDKYQTGQNFYGLDTLSLNNMVGDNTYMKDYLAYEMMDFLGVPSPLTNYAKVTINGEDMGTYLILERYDDAFLERALGGSGGELYNVKTTMQAGDRGEGRENRGEGGRPNFGDGQMPDFPGGGGGPGGSSSGGDLVYRDNDPDSYPSIFENTISKKNSDKDKARLIKAIKALNEGENIEKYWDVEEILAYLAAHTFMVNLDSYSSNMAQNYYLYELDGKVKILPWDYGLSLGGFSSGGASSVINFPIDTPVSGVTMESRPLIDQLLAVDEYREIYHAHLQNLVDNYINSGQMAETITNIQEKLAPYIAESTNDLISYQTFIQGSNSLEQVLTLRAESVAGQLAGTIPSTTEGQSANPELLVSADGVNLSETGSMMGGRGGDRGDRGNFTNQGQGNDGPATGQNQMNERPTIEGQATDRPTIDRPANGRQRSTN